MNIEYMKLAYKQAQIAYKEDEVPVGCVIVKDDVILARAHNKKEKKNLATAHAEIECINKAAKKLNNWNLNGAEMYVTLEPCLMCTGAIINSRISNIYYSTKDPKGGALVSSLKLEDIKTINHHPKIYEGLLQEESSQLLKSFFKRKRNFPGNIWKYY